MDSNQRDPDSRAARRNDYHKVSVGGWIGTLLLSAIPGVNLILWFVWAFSAKRPSRRTYARALLILTLAGAVVCLVCVMLWGEAIYQWANAIYLAQLQPAA